MKDIDSKELLELVGKKSLVEVVLNYWLGRWVVGEELKMFEEMMVLAVDHGPDSPSAKATSEVAGVNGMDLVRSVEAGIGKIDESHGGAIEGLGRILQEDSRHVGEIVEDYLKSNKKIPGFGHRVYKDEDPRAKYLVSRSMELGISGKSVQKVAEIEEELERQKGKKLVLNIDGAMAAILSDLGVSPTLMNGFFLWPRVAGLVYRYKMAVSNK